MSSENLSTKTVLESLKSNKKLFAHSLAVEMLSVEIAKIIELDSINCVRKASFFHDIGKITIDLDKKEKISSEDKKNHVVFGNIITKINGMDDISYIVLTHHENWDGSGYILGLKGTAIPIEARVIRIADSIHAMLSREYNHHHRKMNWDEIKEELKRYSKSYYDPFIIPLVLKEEERIKNVIDKIEMLNSKIEHIDSNIFMGVKDGLKK